jgi:DUF4097 and DUF4098 domain-containing protein YvlB
MLFLVPALPGCSAILANAVRASRVEQRSFDVPAQSAVVVETFNGEIHVAAAAGNKVEAKITRIGSGADQQAAEADLENVQVAAGQDGKTVRIIARRTGSKLFGSSGANIDLKVPPDASLKLTTSNGEIVSAGVQGDIAARSSNGQLEAAGARGKVDLETTNGAIRVDAIGAVVSAQSTNGNVTFAGSLGKGSHRLSTSNGSIRLELPSSAPFRFDADTSNGSVRSGFPGLQTNGGKPGSNRWSASAGSGSDVDVHLETSNGSITIEPLQPAEAPAAR